MQKPTRKMSHIFELFRSGSVEWMLCILVEIFDTKSNGSSDMNGLKAVLFSLPFCKTLLVHINVVMSFQKCFAVYVP